MKIKMSVIAVCSILLMCSCGSGNNNTTLENSNNLLATEVKVVNGDTLTGVRTIFDTIQVVPMAKWDSLKAISPEVVKAYRGGSMYAYTAKGHQMGDGALKKLLTVTSVDGVTFYKGEEAVNETAVFYFPSSGDIMEGVTDMYIGRTVALFETSHGWETRSYDGKLLWQIGDKEMVILKRSYAEKETIQIVFLTREGASIYDTTGELVREVPMAAWLKATKAFSRSQKIGQVRYGELNINYTF